MRIDDNSVCKVCKDVFCCAECRQKHEANNHDAIVVCISQDTEGIKGAKSDFKTTCRFCPICEERPLVLRPELHNEMLLHMELYHLPLRCRKCFKTYNKINDLKEFSKCVHPTIVWQNKESLASNLSCCTDDASKVTVTKGAMLNSLLEGQDLNESHMTPISIINMRWKAKSKLTHEEFISDSVSSIRNLSSINNSSIKRSTKKSSGVKGKIIRCSSTPVHLEMVFAKPKEQTFNATGGGHMSSIQYTSEYESDHSPAFPQPNSQQLEPVNRHIKVTVPRPRMSAATPLRQVMSKSIHKAFAELGFPASHTIRGSSIFPRKNMFDSTSSLEVPENQSPQKLALDLRLSPAVRRSQSESDEILKNRLTHNHQKGHSEFANLRREIRLSAQKLTTASIVITRTEHLSSVTTSTSAASSNSSINSVRHPGSTNCSYQSARSNNSTSGSMYKSCQSVKIITATTEEIQELQSFDGGNVKHAVMPPVTPITRIPGAVIQKKYIKFETPKVELYKPLESHNSPNDVYFTPNASPIRNNGQSVSTETRVKKNLTERFSPRQKPSIKECAQSTVFSRIENMTNDFDDFHYDDDEVFFPEDTKFKQKLNNVRDNKSSKPRGLWSFMSSVMRLPSHNESKDSKELNSSDNSRSIIKRCASIAGSLVRSKSLVNENELNSLKRKRTYSTDNQSTAAYLAELNNSESTSPTSSGLNTSTKRIRIQGRRPIDRMRLNN